MKYNTALASFTMVIAALGAPAELDAHSGGGSSRSGSASTCSASDGKEVCCVGGGACFVQVLGFHCPSDSYCCDTEAPVGVLLNVDGLSCVSLEVNN